MVTKKNSRNPWAWIPTLYFAEGLPNVIVRSEERRVGKEC